MDVINEEHSGINCSILTAIDIKQSLASK